MGSGERRQRKHRDEAGHCPHRSGPSGIGIDRQPQTAADQESKIAAAGACPAGLAAGLLRRGMNGERIGCNVLGRGNESHREENNGKRRQMGLRGKTGRNAEKDDQGKLADQDPVALCPKPVDKRSPEKLESPGHYQDGEKADPVERHTGIAQCDGERRLHHASRRGLGSVKPAQQSENDVGRGPCAVFGYSSQVQHSCSANGLLQSKKLDLHSGFPIVRSGPLFLR